MGFRHALGMNISEMFRGKQHERSCDLTFLGHHLCTTPSRRIVLLIRFWHPELPVERWRDTLDAGMEDFAAMLRRRVSPPANAAVAEAWWRPPIGGMGERWSRPCSQSIITYQIVHNFPPRNLWFIPFYSFMEWRLKHQKVIITTINPTPSFSISGDSGSRPARRSETRWHEQVGGRELVKSWILDANWQNRRLIMIGTVCICLPCFPCFWINFPFRSLELIHWLTLRGAEAAKRLAVGYLKFAEDMSWIFLLHLMLCLVAIEAIPSNTSSCFPIFETGKPISIDDHHIYSFLHKLHEVLSLLRTRLTWHLVLKRSGIWAYWTCARISTEHCSNSDATRRPFSTQLDWKTSWASLPAYVNGGTPVHLQKFFRAIWHWQNSLGRIKTSKAYRTLYTYSMTYDILWLTNLL